MVFWNFWIFIVIDILVIIGFLGWCFWFFFLDTRLRLFIIYPNKQISIFKKKIKNDVVDIYDKNSNTHKLYTVNKNFIYYRMGRIPHAFYWNNIPIPENITQQLNFTPEQLNLLKQIDKKYPIQIDISKPNTKLKHNIELDTADTFFRVLNTNFTLNLLKPSTDIKKAVKWTVILIVVAIILALILHFLGVIDVMQLLGAKPPT